MFRIFYTNPLGQKNVQAGRMASNFVRCQIYLKLNTFGALWPLFMPTRATDTYNTETVVQLSVSP